MALRAEQNEIEAEIKLENKEILSNLKDFFQTTNLNKILVELNANYEVTEIRLPLTSSSSVLRIAKDDPIWKHFRYKDYEGEKAYRLYKRAIRMNKRERTKRKRT